MPFTRQNALDQALDIAGSLTTSQNFTLADEALGYGPALSGQTGAAASITTFSSPYLTFTGLTGMTANSVGNFLTVSGAASSGNNGTFLISQYISATSVVVINASGVAFDANNGSITWTERYTYRLEDDINYIRTDRKLIKGTSNWYDEVPLYQRPTAIGTNVPANLANIAGKTTDAQGFIFPRGFRAQAVANNNTFVTLSSPGNLKHSDAVDKTGVPCFDTAPYAGDHNACYALITNPVNDQQFTVIGGPNDGYVIFGRTRSGSSTSPNSIEVEFRAVPHGTDISSSVPFTWNTSYLPTSIDITYGYFTRLDQADEYSFRRLEILGVTSDADLRLDMDQMQQIVGTPDGATSLNTLLTNTTNYFPFVNLPDATPSVVEALNTLNAQIGNRNYTGPYLVNGQTITASLQALSNAISGAGVTRYIERLSADLPANTAHTLPGAATYTPDGTFNGRNLWLFSRGLLRHPGVVSQGNDYAETSTTSVTFYSKHKSGDIIDYFVKS
mgnify:CR=1 FL=1